MARENRQNSTPAEQVLWQSLRNRQLKGAKFRRQHPLHNFIVDFYSHEYKLVIEVDGGYHLNYEQSDYDDGRTHELEQLGLKVLRFTNEQVLNNLADVLGKIEKHLIPNPSP